ncbi:MAG TPA: S53 family peptidase [Candidatus Tyrphobacter sp.]
MRNAYLAVVALALLTASCAGHGAGSAMLPSGTGVQSAASTAGAATVRRTAMTVAVPSGWSATGTMPLALSGASDLGAVAATQSITVRIGLQLNDVAALKSAVAAKQRISSAAFRATYAPTASQVSQVQAYLQSQGLSNITVEPNDLVVSATGTAAQVEKAFNTKLENYSQGGQTVYANTSAAFVPQSLSGIVIAVLGLNDIQGLRVTPHHAGVADASPAPTAPPGTPESPCTLYGLEILAAPTPLPEPASSTVGCLRNYLPADYWRAYDAGTTPTGNGTTVAIMTIGGLGNAVSDLRVNEQNDGLPEVPVTVKQIGLATAPITNGPDEWTLDMTASSGMAAQLTGIDVYDTTSFSDSDVILMYNRWVTDDVAQVANSSFGGCEAFEYVDGAMLLADEIFLEGASQGQTMFASAGDTGSFCPVAVGENGVPAGAPMVNWPAASSYVTAVGGTTLLTDNDGNYQGETTWYSGGGGVSQFEYSPYWQTSQPLGGNFRGVPDIAMDGDLQTGMIIYLSDAGGWTVIGGTSLSSPLAAGVWARMLQSHAGLGFAPPVLYQNFSSHAAGAQQTGPPPWQPDGGFHDILVGGNGMYTALPGYDYTTGLGSFDISVMNGQL